MQGDTDIMTMLIFGASGNIGGATAAAMEAAGAGGQLRLVTHRPEGVAQLAERFPGREVVVADLFDGDSLRAALAGVSAVFMNVPDMTPEPDATANLVAAMKDVAAGAFVLRFGAWPPGFVLEDLTPVTRETGIGAAKHLRSRPVLAASGLAHAFLNAPCWFMTNLPWMSLAAIRERDELLIPCPHSTPWIAPEDIGEAAAAVLLRPNLQVSGREYTITGPQMLTFEQVAQILSRLLGRTIRYNDSVEDFRGYFGDATDPMVAYFDNSRQDYHGMAPTDTLAGLLGRAPTAMTDWLAARRTMFDA